MPSSPRLRWLLPVLVIALTALGGCTVPPPEGAAPLRYRDLVFPTVTETPDVQYGENTGLGGVPQKLFMDIYRPAGDTAKKRPAIIWMHGGSFSGGSRKDGLMVELSRRFARRGYVAVSISYRLLAAEACGGEASTARCVPAAMSAADDERAAIRYLRSKAAELGIDESRIAIGGASAGAVASVLAGATPDTAGNSGNPGFSSASRAVVSISGGLPTTIMFTRGDPPMLFWHGTQDTVVPYAWAKQNAEYMMQNGMIGILRNVEAGHVPATQFGDDMDEQARNFLYRVMSLQVAEAGGV